MNSIACNILIGLFSGVLSGMLVYWVTKKREEKRENYYFWFNYLFKVMDHCKIFIPSEEIERASAIGKRGSKWYTAIHEILDEINPYEIEDRELNSHEERISKNVIIALTELNLWKKKNHL